MGIKSALISLQMIPWCFPTSLIWNHMSCAHLGPEEPAVVGTIKLIKSDGIVKIYHQPINASDLMMEFPKHLVCHSDSFYIGQKIQPLSPNDKLQLGHKYFLLPNHFFQSVLSFVTIASFAAASSRPPPQSSLIPSSSYSVPIISNTNNNNNNNNNNNKNYFLKKVAATNCQPFDIRKTPSGSLQIRVSDEFISKLMEENRDQQLVVVDDDDDQEKKKSAGSSRVCTTAQLQKDYSQLVGSSRQWKPKLETITESKRRLGGSFGIPHRIRNYNKQSKSHPHHKIQPKGYSSSSSTPQQQLMNIHKSSDHQYLHHHHHHVTAAASISSPPAAHPSKIKVIKTKGRKICKF